MSVLKECFEQFWPVFLAGFLYLIVAVFLALWHPVRYEQYDCDRMEVSTQVIEKVNIPTIGPTQQYFLTTEVYGSIEVDSATYYQTEIGDTVDLVVYINRTGKVESVYLQNETRRKE